MHGNGMTPSVQNGLGIFYLIVAVMNVFFAAWRNEDSRNRTRPLVWGLVAGIFLIHAIAYFLHANWVLSDGIKQLINNAMNPVSYFVLATLALISLLYFRKPLTDASVGWSLLMVILLFSGWAMTDVNFKNIIT